MEVLLLILSIAMVIAAFVLRDKFTGNSILDFFANGYIFMLRFFIPKNGILNLFLYNCLFVFIFAPVQGFLLRDVFRVDIGVLAISYVFVIILSGLYVAVLAEKKSSKPEFDDVNLQQMLFKILALGVVFGFMICTVSICGFAMFVSLFGIADVATEYLKENFLAQCFFVLYMASFAFVPMRVRGIFLFNFDTYKFNDFDYDDRKARQTPSFRAGKDSADGAAVL
jgi:hypothetical protein